MIAIDGQVAANASRDRTMDYEQLAKAIVEEQIATDIAEDKLHEQARGDELPPELARSKGRQAWLREPKRRLDEQRAAEGKRIPRSRPERLKDASDDWTRSCGSNSANEAYEAYRARGVGRTGRRFSPAATPKPHTPPGKVNITDPDSKLVKSMRGWIQGYNAQAVCNERHLIVAAEVMTASPGLRAPRPDGRRRAARADRRRGHEAARRGRCRRRLLASRADERDHRPRHPGS